MFDKTTPTTRSRWLGWKTILCKEIWKVQLHLSWQSSALIFSVYRSPISSQFTRWQLWSISSACNVSVSWRHGSCSIRLVLKSHLPCPEFLPWHFQLCHLAPPQGWWFCRWGFSQKSALWQLRLPGECREVTNEPRFGLKKIYVYIFLTLPSRGQQLTAIKEHNPILTSLYTVHLHNWKSRHLEVAKVKKY